MWMQCDHGDYKLLGEPFMEADGSGHVYPLRQLVFKKDDGEMVPAPFPPAYDAPRLKELIAKRGLDGATLAEVYLSREESFDDAAIKQTDMVKDESILVAAYDDRDGATAEFNLNILRRLNRELAADFDPANFQHRALWNGPASRIEMHLESSCDHHVCMPGAGLDLDFRAFETIHTENSYKFTDEAIRTLLEDAGFAVEHRWTDSREWFALTLARVP